MIASEDPTKLNHFYLFFSNLMMISSARVYFYLITETKFSQKYSFYIFHLKSDAWILIRTDLLFQDDPVGLIVISSEFYFPLCRMKFVGTWIFILGMFFDSAISVIISRKMGRSSRTIYVGNLPGDIRETEIEDLFYKVFGVLIVNYLLRL